MLTPPQSTSFLQQLSEGLTPEGRVGLGVESPTRYPRRQLVRPYARHPPRLRRAGADKDRRCGVVESIRWCGVHRASAPSVRARHAYRASDVAISRTSARVARRWFGFLQCAAVLPEDKSFRVDQDVQ